MRRPLAVAAGVVLLLAAACSSDQASLDAEDRAACSGYHELVNAWSTDYGAELGAVGQAAAAGDEGRQETAVAVVRELFTEAATEMRAEAEQTSHDELSEALSEAADGLDEIADQIETYDDVTAAPQMMSEGQFATAGEQVSALCAAS